MAMFDHIMIRAALNPVLDSATMGAEGLDPEIWGKTTEELVRETASREAAEIIGRALDLYKAMLPRYMALREMADNLGGDPADYAYLLP